MLTLDSPRPSDPLCFLPSQNYAPFISKSKRFDEKPSPKQAQQRYSILPEINMDNYHPKNSPLRHSTQENKTSTCVFTSKVNRFLLPQNGVPGPAFYTYNQGKTQSQSLHHSPAVNKFVKVLLTRASPSIPDIRNRYRLSKIDKSDKLEFKDGKHVEQQRRLMHEYLQSLDKITRDKRISKGQEREEIYKQKQKILEKVQAAFGDIQIPVEEKENIACARKKEAVRRFHSLNKNKKRQPQYAVVYRKWPRTHQNDKIEQKMHIHQIDKTKFQFFGTSQIRFKREMNAKPLKTQKVFLPLHVLSKY